MSSYKRCKYKIVLFDYGGTLTDVDEMGGQNQAAEIGADGHERKDGGRSAMGKQQHSKRFRPARSDIESYRDLLGIKKVTIFRAQKYVVFWCSILQHAMVHDVGTLELENFAVYF